MLTRLTGMAGAFCVVAGARFLAGDAPPAEGADTAMALGFVLLVSFLAGELAVRARVPAITGYLLTGILFGPYVLQGISGHLVILDRPSVSALQLLDGVALGLIALTAGGELKLDIVRRRWKAIGSVTALQTVVVFGGVGGAVFALRGLFPSLAGLGTAAAAAMAGLFAITAVANSPSTTIAIIQECRARGPMTELVLGITVLKDVVVISLFTLVLSGSLLLVRPEAGLDAAFLGSLAWEVFGSIGLGLLVGWLVRLYMRHVGRELPLVILGAAFLSVAVSGRIHVSGLLLCMTAGFYIENFTRHGEEMIRAIERHSLPVYVLFFTIAGASLNLESLLATWPLATTIVACRLACTWLGTSAGARLAGADRSAVRLGWTGFVAQAGVTLGLAVLIERNFPDTGAYLKSVIVGAIAVNQLIGPVLFKLGLHAAGEALPDPEESCSQEQGA